MAQLPLSCCWRPGALRPFESVASLGAKYCYLNKIRFIDFWEMLSEFLPQGTDVPEGTYALDAPGFNIGRFAHYLGEPVSIANTMLLKKAIPGPHLQAVYGSKYTPDFNYKALRFCPACLAHGYHSNLHQMEWMAKCFIHGEPLKSNLSASATSSHLTLRLIQPLYIYWFKPEKLYLAADRIWPAAKSPVWAFGDHELIWKDGLKVISMLRAAEKRLPEAELRSPRVIGNPTGARLVMAMNTVRPSNPHLSEMMNPRCLKLKHAHQFICSAEEAKAILDLDDHDLSLLMHSRQVMCAISGLRPPWKLILDELEQQLSSGHGHCLKLLYESTFYGEKIRLGNTNQFVQAPFNRALFHSVPCDRIVTLNFLQDLQDIEEDNPFSLMSLTELSWDKSHWPSLESLGLVGHVSGFIRRNGHRLFRSDNLYFQANSPDADDLRQCQLHAPVGVLADIIDGMILAHVWSWNWALFHMERKAEHLTDARYYPEDFLRDEANALKPLFSLQKSPSGLAMKVGTFALFKSPPWRTCLGDEQEHMQEVTHLYHFMLDRLHEKIDKGMKQITLNDPVVRWLRETNDQYKRR